MLIRTNNATKSFYALSHIYALRIEMIDVIFVQVFLSAKIELYWSLFNTACMGCLHKTIDYHRNTNKRARRKQKNSSANEKYYSVFLKYARQSTI